jgi:Ca2+-binding EF-hand superfamily protein
MIRIAALSLLAATVLSGHAHANAPDGERGGDMRQMRAEMRELIQGDGMDVADLANMMQTRAEARFARLDADGDGVVTREEFNESGMRRAGRMFRQLDADGDGELTMAEFTANVADRAERMFSRMDRDGDGRVTAEDRPRNLARADRPGQAGMGPRGMGREMRELMRGDGMTAESLAGLMEERAGARFDRLDADGDGMISREEFMAGLGERAERMVARMDRNEDGVVTRDDRPRFNGKRGGHHRWHR